VNAEITEFLLAGLRPVSCRVCGTRVLVKKHTSIQWTTDPASSCHVFAERAAAGENTALLDTCERLSDSITYAVQEGLLEVVDE
jgi:DNA-directed RNA polymerase subunit RPC12/RpoP